MSFYYKVIHLALILQGVNSSCGSAMSNWFATALTLHRILGGYSVRVPPLPIPNREVKPDNADGTA